MSDKVGPQQLPHKHDVGANPADFEKLPQTNNFSFDQANLGSLSPQGVLQLQRTVGNHQAVRLLQRKSQDRSTIQRMKVRGTDKGCTLSSATAKKHVEPLATQATRAKAEYGSRTFVTDASLITSVVDANAHDFTEALNKPSARFDFQATVKVSVYMKTPPDLGEGENVAQTVNEEDKLCEIGVIKKGDDSIQVTHFKIV